MNLSIFYNIPLWLVGLVIFIILLSALEIGFRTGLKRHDLWKDADQGGGNIVQTSLFAVLGLVLAFTYSSSVSRYDARKAAVTTEANAIGTAFLRSDLLVEPGKTELKTTLLDYARTRTVPRGSVQNDEDRKVAIARTLGKLEKIWPATVKAVSNEKPGPLLTSVITAINSALDAHTIRIEAVFDRLPTVIIWMLIFIAAAALSVAGFNAGIQGRISRFRVSIFSAVLTVLIIVILDFDRPNVGLVIVENTHIDNLIVNMEERLDQ